MICDHPILAKILQLCLELTRDGKEIVFIWLLVLWALEEILLQTLLLRMPSIATSRMSFHNKLHEVFPQLNDCISCPRSNRREETLISRLHIGHSYVTQSFLLKGEEPPVSCLLYTSDAADES